MLLLGIALSISVNIFKSNINSNNETTKHFNTDFKLNRVLQLISNRLELSIKDSIISSQNGNNFTKLSNKNSANQYEWLINYRYLKYGIYDNTSRINIGFSGFIDINKSNNIYLTPLDNLSITNQSMLNFTNNSKTLTSIKDTAIVFKNDLKSIFFGWNHSKIEKVYFVKLSDNKLFFLNNNNKILSNQYIILTDANGLIYLDKTIYFCNKYRPYNNEIIRDKLCNILSDNISYFNISKQDSFVVIKICIKINNKNICKEAFI
jgi:hypothetical protein